MFDTTNWTTCRRLLPEVDQAVREDNPSGLPPGWSFREGKTSRSGSFFSTRRITLDHEPTGLHVHGTPGRLEGWSASLPRVLHGYNGIQPKDDIEIAASRVRVNELLDEISHPSETVETLRRLDAAMNLAAPDTEALLTTLRNANHPWIRREKERYAIGNIRLPGTKVVFNAYWKKPPTKTGARQKKWHTPGVLRLEVQLKSIDKIGQFLGHRVPAPLTELPRRREVYGAFRRFILGFQSRKLHTGKCTLSSLIARCESVQFVFPEGDTAMDWHRTTSEVDTHRKMQKTVAANTAQFLSVDWAELLPGHMIPATVDVFADGTTKAVPPVPLTRTWSAPRGNQLRDWMAASAAIEDAPGN